MDLARLRHVFCTTALFTWKLDATDVSCMAGHAIDVAVAWQRASAGDWASYAADVSRRTRLQPVPSRHETQDQE